MPHVTRAGRAAAGAVVLLALGWVVLSAVLVVTGMSRPEPGWSLWPAAIGATATAVLSCLLTAVYGTGPARTFWLRLAAGAGALTVGAICHAARTYAVGHVAPMDAPTAGFYIAAVAGAIVSLLLLPGQPRGWRALVAMYLDVAIVGVAAAIVVSHILWITPLPANSRNLAAGLLGIAVTCACTGILAVIKVGITGAGPVHGPSLWYLTPIGVFAPLTWVIYPHVQRWPHISVTALVLPWLGLLFALAARSQILARPVRARRTRMRGISGVPYAAVAITGAMLLTVTLRTGFLSPGLAGGAVVLMVLVMVRQLAALTDNAVLLDRLDEHAHRDDLTGLPNRRLFGTTLQRSTAPSVVAVCDLDGFSTLNDRLGDEKGDALLRAAADRLREAAGDGAVVARLLGDEFGIMVPGERAGLAADLVQAFRTPLRVEGHDLLVTVTAGVAGGVGGDLLRRAELALKTAQRAGRNRWQEHTPEMDHTARHDADMAAALRRGLERGEFRLFYQPIVELPGGRITGVEALVRWLPADGPMVSPAAFIPVAEHTGLILDLGLWIIETACADAAAWQRRHGDDAPRVNINVSARQLLDPELPGHLAAAMARHGVNPAGITCEITETAVFDGGAALATVRELRDLGVGVALDDFGTGQSSLTLLRTCPVTTLKVDKSFIDELNGTAEQEAIASSLSTIARTMGLRAVAEGVETREQADRLEALGYRYAQGFYFFKPAPATEIDDKIISSTYSPSR
ncbi:EAL domain-containing protein [Actinoplanes sp. NPDC051851]|uniref:putative bifunctional diguanylate cyclase/phosphodiesterase n=1 Tax=Actinoplanes sp. NPDC051851 TaxID=3154753 RepID=UPI00342C848C